MGDEKQIRLVFGVDEQSAQKSQRIIQGIIKDLNTLVTTAQAASRAMAFGTGGGGGAGVAVSGTRLGPGSGGATHLASRATNSDGMVGIVAGMGAAFKGMGDSGKTSLKTLEESVRRTVDNSVNDISRLRSAIEQLSVSYGKLPGGFGGGGAGGGGTLIGLGPQGAPSPAAAPVTAPGAMAVPTGGGGRGGGGVLGGLVSAAQGAGIPIGATYAATAIATIGLASNILATREDANIAYRVAYPMLGSSQAVAGGAQFAGMAMGIRGGDVASAMALQNVLKSGAHKALMQSQDDRILAARRKAGFLTDESGQPLEYTNSVSAAGQAAYGNIATGDIPTTRIYNRDTRQWTTVAAPGAARGKRRDARGNIIAGEDRSEDSRELEFSAAKASIASGIAGDVNTLVQQEKMKAENQRLFQYANEIYAETPGRYAAARATRRSLVRNPLTGMSSMDELEIRAAAAGRSVAEYGDIEGSFGAYAWGNRGKGSAYLGRRGGGISNVAALYAAGSQFGGGGEFIDTLNRSIGRGGVDITTGSGLAGTLSEYATRGNFTGDLSPALNGLLGQAYTGTPGGDIRQARILAQGMAAYQKVATGVDPVNRSMNAVFAARAGAGAQEGLALQQLAADPLVIRSIMAGGEVPELAKQLGLDRGTFENYQNQRQNAMFVNYVGKAGTPAAMAVKALRESGLGTNQYIQRELGKKLSGVTDKAERARITDEVMSPFAAARAVSNNLTWEQAKGSLATEFSSWATQDVLGKGAGDIASKGSPEAQAAKTMAKLLKERAKFIGDPEKLAKIDAAIAGMKESADTADTLGAAGASGSLNKLGAALEAASKASMTASGELSKIEAAKRGGAPAPQKTTAPKGK